MSPIRSLKEKQQDKRTTGSQPISFSFSRVKCIPFSSFEISPPFPKYIHPKFFCLMTTKRRIDFQEMKSNNMDESVGETADAEHYSSIPSASLVQK